MYLYEKIYVWDESLSFIATIIIGLAGGGFINISPSYQDQTRHVDVGIFCSNTVLMYRAGVFLSIILIAKKNNIIDVLLAVQLCVLVQLTLRMAW